MKWKIIADSGCDYRSLDNRIRSLSVSRDHQVGETIYTDWRPTQYRSDDEGDVCDYIASQVTVQVLMTMKSFEGAESSMSWSPSLEPFQVATIVLRWLRRFIWKSIEYPISTSLITHQLGGELGPDLKLNQLIAEGPWFWSSGDVITTYSLRRSYAVFGQVDNLVKNGRLQQIDRDLLSNLNIVWSAKL